jgi:AbrB family looped-hinge helix DNA binding protein
MRVTTKGQVTIPLPVRRQLGIEPGDEVEFVLHEGQAILRPVDETPGERLAARLMGSATSTEFTRTEEIMRLTRGDD